MRQLLESIDENHGGNGNVFTGGGVILYLYPGYKRIKGHPRKPQTYQLLQILYCTCRMKNYIVVKIEKDYLKIKNNKLESSVQQESLHPS